MVRYFLYGGGTQLAGTIGQMGLYRQGHVQGAGGQVGRGAIGQGQQAEAR